MKTLIVPVDFSQTSVNAMRVAADLADRFQATVKLLHVQGVPLTDPYAAGTVAQIDAELEKVLHERIRDLWKTLASESEDMERIIAATSVETLVRTGFAAGEIARLADEESADWIVMGTRGASGFGGALFGSVTAAVTGRSSRPVLAVPADAEPRAIKRIACAIEDAIEDPPTLQRLDDLAAHFGAELDFVHVVKEQEASMTGATAATMGAFREMDAQSPVRVDVLSGKNVERSLDEFIEREKVDMLVMLHERHNLFERLFRRSETRRMLLHTHIPTLVLPAS